MQETLFVPRDFVMDPEDDDLLFDGTHLKPGMVVLLEDSSLRGDPAEAINRYNKVRILESARWCTVLLVNVRPRYEHDQYGSVIGPMSPLVEFLAEYPDGTKAKRSYDASYAWYVKKFSIPQETVQ